MSKILDELRDLPGPHKRSRRQHIIARASDAMTNLLYYDRKEDEELGVGEIGATLSVGEIAVDEMLEIFRAALESEAK